MRGYGCALDACGMVFPAVGFLNRPLERVPFFFFEIFISRNVIIVLLKDMVKFKLKLFLLIADMKALSMSTGPSQMMKISSM